MFYQKSIRNSFLFFSDDTLKSTQKKQKLPYHFKKNNSINQPICTTFSGRFTVNTVNRVIQGIVLQVISTSVASDTCILRHISSQKAGLQPSQSTEKKKRDVTDINAFKKALKASVDNSSNYGFPAVHKHPQI